MATRAYRRKIHSVNLYTETSNKNQYILPDYITAQKGECEIDQIRNYFYNVLDMIIQQANFTDAVGTLRNILDSVHPMIEYYKIMDTIEYNLLSTVMNISDNVNTKVIQLRIDYIKTHIETLPPICQSPGPVSKMIMELLDTMIRTVDFEKISQTIQNLQSYLQSKYGCNETMELIQSNLLSVIGNIGNGAPSKIIELRINFVKELLVKL